MDREELIRDIERLLELSRFYFHDSTYKEHVKNLKKLKKHLEKGEDDKCFKKGCKVDE